MTDHCYICLDEEGKLLRPCLNKKCTARVHHSCLEKQLQTNQHNQKCICEFNINIRLNDENYLTKIYPLLCVLFIHPLLWILAATTLSINIKDKFNQEFAIFLTAIGFSIAWAIDLYFYKNENISIKKRCFIATIAYFPSLLMILIFHYLVYYLLPDQISGLVIFIITSMIIAC